MSRAWFCRALTFGEALKHKNLLVVDVRTLEEVVAGGTCPGSLHVPVSNIPVAVAEFGNDKSRPIVFYCKKGIRAASAAQMLAQLGYTNAFSATDGPSVAKLLNRQSSS